MSVGILSGLTLSMGLAETDSSCNNLCIWATGHAQKGAVILIHRQVNTAVSSAVGSVHTTIVSIALTPEGHPAIPRFLGPLEAVKAACLANSQGCILTQTEGGPCWWPVASVTND